MIKLTEKNITKYVLVFIISFIVIFCLIFFIIFFYFNKNTLKVTNQVFNEIFINHIKNQLKLKTDFVFKEISSSKNLLEKKLKENLKKDVLMIHSLLFNLLNEFKMKKANNEEIKPLLLNMIKHFKNNERNYFFILNASGKIIYHPWLKYGTNVINVTDCKGVYIVKDFIRLALTKDEAYYKYYWYASKEKKEMEQKLAFIKSFKPFNWIIIKVFFIKDFEKILQKRIKEFIERHNTVSNFYFLIKINKDEQGKIYGKILISPYEKFKDNIVTFETEDYNHLKYFKKMVNLATVPPYHGYLEFSPLSKNDNRLIFVKYFKDWSWIVGAGEQLSKAYSYMNNTGKYYFELLKKNIIIFYFLILVCSLFALILSLGFSKKISSTLKNYRKKIRERESFLRNLMDILPLPLFISNLDGEITTGNQELKNLITKSEKQGLISNNDILKNLIKTDVMLIKNNVKKEFPKITELQMIDPKSGELKDLIIYKTLYKNENEEPLGVIGGIWDVTEQKKLENRLQELAITDELTGIYNRRHFNTILENEFFRFKRFGTIFSVVMFDIDYFKKINDTYGHHVGDLILKELTNVVKNSIRNIDFFGRWGGEEFTIIAVQIGRENASKLAEKLRKILGGHNFGYGFKVTCSFGVTSVDKDDTIESLLIRVDKALYIAKQRGRNRVEIL